MNSHDKQDPDAMKGTIEPDRPEDDADSNMAELNEQLDHRFQDPMNKSSDSGMPGTGQTGEYSMETEGENELSKDTGQERRSTGCLTCSGSSRWNQAASNFLMDPLPAFLPCT